MILLLFFVEKTRRDPYDGKLPTTTAQGLQAERFEIIR